MPRNNDNAGPGGLPHKGGEDKKADRVVKIRFKEVYIELKTTTECQGLDYSLYDDGSSHKIKFHQICVADYFILEYRPNKPVVVKKADFLNWAARQKKNSINYKDTQSIGFEIDNMEWLKEV